MSKNNS